MNVYSGRCVMSDCDCPEALEAAHIHPYRGDETNDVTNGLLLRADIHTLFDLGKISIDADRYTIIISPSLRKTVYGKLDGLELYPPKNPRQKPSVEALKKHRLMAGL